MPLAALLNANQMGNNFTLRINGLRTKQNDVVHITLARTRLRAGASQSGVDQNQQQQQKGDRRDEERERRENQI